jgi:predicted acylesterase/phospholipase RssA
LSTERALAERAAELLELFRTRPLLSSLDLHVLTELVESCEVLHAPGGTRLIGAGQRLDGVYGVLHGALRMVRRGPDGVESAIHEYYREDMLGFLGMFVDQPIPVDLIVVRDSTLVKISRERFLILTEKHPELLRAVLSLMSRHVNDVLGTVVSAGEETTTRREGNIGLLALSGGPAVREARPAMIRLMIAEGAMTHVTAERVDVALGPGTADADGDPRVARWLDDLEHEAPPLYECDLGRPGWAARCIRQSDRLVIVATPADAASIDQVAAMLARGSAGGVSRRTDLVIVHPAGSGVPSQTQAWSRLSAVTRIHHVRAGEGRDLERVARHVTDQPIGVALSGGGARALAHLGVLAAMIEAEIPIDYVCGTSMGAIVAASLAMGWSIERMRASVSEIFTSRLALYDLTLPISSLLAGKKLDRVLHTLFGDTEIEDLWLPFFCVSTDLSRATLVVHDRGTLWKSVRASCSIPGLFPPLSLDGRALVDGGLMDNLPIDVLAERCSGSLIAVDAFPYGERSVAEPTGVARRWFRRTRTRLETDLANPPLFDILVRSTFVGSKYRQEATAARLKHVHYLALPLAEFGVLRWRAHRDLFEAGYTYAKRRIREASLQGPAPGTPAFRDQVTVVT